MVGEAEHRNYSLLYSFRPPVSGKEEMGPSLGVRPLRTDGGAASGIPFGLWRTGRRDMQYPGHRHRAVDGLGRGKYDTEEAGRG